MKKRLTILFFIFCSISFGQIPDYFENNPEWRVRFYEGINANTQRYVYYISDTVNISGYDYQEISKRGSDEYPFYPPIPFDYVSQHLRQVGETIHFIHQNIDTVLVDYNMQIGDSLKNHHFNVFPYLDTLTLQKIDSVLIGSGYRNTFWFDTLNLGPVIIEGIGFQLQSSGNEGEFIESLGEGIGFTYSLICYSQNGNTEWVNVNSSQSCYFDVSIRENKILDVSIHPNPSSNGWITVESNNLLVNSSYQYYSITGQKVLDGRFENNVIPTPIRAGVYVLVIGDESYYYHQKVVVE